MSENRPRDINWLTIPAAVAVIAVACCLHLDVLPVAFCLIPDEAFSWRLAAQPSPARLVELTARDVHPPLYYLCLSAWMSAFGASESALRGLSGVFSVGTVLATFWYARAWAGDPGRAGSPAAAVL